MRQLSLLTDNHAALAGVMPAIRAAMRVAAGASEGEGRKALPDKLNALAISNGIRLTAGNARTISKDTLDKWLSPSDVAHPPSILALLAFCLATEDIAPLRAMLKSVGLDVMTAEDRKLRDYGKAVLDMKAAQQRKRKLEEGL